MFSYGVRHTVILTWRALTGSRFEGEPSRLGSEGQSHETRRPEHDRAIRAGRVRFLCSL